MTSWKLVPSEPTIEMIDAACAKWVTLYPAFEGEKPQPTAGQVVEAIYLAMLEAVRVLENQKASLADAHSKNPPEAEHG